MDKQRRTKSQRVGLKDICAAAITTNDEGEFTAEVPVRLAKEMSATVKSNYKGAEHEERRYNWKMRKM